MVQGLIDVENPHFGGNTLIHSEKFVNILTRINFGMCMNGSVWRHALGFSLMMQIWRSISGTCYLIEVVLGYIFMFVHFTFMGSNSLSIRVVLILKPLLV